MEYRTLLLSSWLLLAGCSESNDSLVDVKQATRMEQTNLASRAGQGPSRWYGQQQVQNGRVLFRQHCAECHKDDASGTPDWRELDATGKYPPPPLNGTAHTWHHSLNSLRRTVRLGSVPLGGTMPGFSDKLSNQEIDAVLAWVQSHWSDEIYAVWHDINAQASR